MSSFSPPIVVGFIDVAQHVLLVAFIALVILIAGLVAAAAERGIEAARRAEAVVFDAIAGMDRETALVFYAAVAERSHNVGIAWLLSLVLGPFGAYAYLGRWDRALLALVSLNGFGAWWMESWFSIPQIVVIERRDVVAATLAQLPFILEQQRLASERPPSAQAGVAA